MIEKSCVLAKFGKLLAHLQIQAADGNNVPITWILVRLEECLLIEDEDAAHEDDDTEGVEREKAMVKAFQEIAVSVEGIRSDLAKAAGLVPIGSGGTARIKT